MRICEVLDQARIEGNRFFVGTVVSGISPALIVQALKSVTLPQTLRHHFHQHHLGGSFGLEFMIVIGQQTLIVGWSSVGSTRKLPPEYVSLKGCKSAGLVSTSMRGGACNEAGFEAVDMMLKMSFPSTDLASPATGPELARQSRFPQLIVGKRVKPRKKSSIACDSLLQTTNLRLLFAATKNKMSNPFPVPTQPITAPYAFE